MSSQQTALTTHHVRDTFGSHQLRLSRLRSCPYRKSHPGWQDAAIGYPRAGMFDILKLLGGWLAGLFILDRSADHRCIPVE